MEIIVSDSQQQMFEYLARKIVDNLSKEYNFDSNEAMSKLSLTKSRKDTDTVIPTKNNIPIPFCGVIQENCCYGIRLNHGLYTQCTNNPCDYSNAYQLCGTCSKQANKNSNNEPTYGFITTRLEQADNFRDPKGKAPVNYGNIMEKLNIKRDEAIKAAKLLGLTIPEEQFIVKKAARGRPKKDTTADDTASESSEIITTEKKRGRPRKDKQVISSNLGDDMIKQLVENNTKSEDNHEIVSEESDEEPECQAYAIILKKNSELGYEIQDDINSKTQYLITADNTLYHPKTHDLLGKWNPKTKCVEQMESSDEEP